MTPEEIKNIRAELDLNQDEFGELIEVSKRSVANYESGDTKPYKRTLLKLNSIKDQIESGKLMKKDARLQLDESKQKSDLENETKLPFQSPVLNNNRKGVPYYDVDFYGGFDFAFNDQTIQPAFMIDYAPYNDCDAWINVSGKSMSPFISHGDIAALKKLNNWQQFIPFGEIYAVLTEEHKTIKIVTAGKDENHLTLVPYNKSREFVEQQIPKKLIHQMYRVKGSIKKFF